MQWLIANMWMALAAATALGLLFGFSFRGLLSSSQVRKARVEREIVKTELSQSKAEVEALYAAQRKRKEETSQAVSGDLELRAELDKRETRITALGDELSAARAELDALKQTAEAGETLVAPVPVPASDEVTQLQDRNAWLEERVTALEADVSAAAVPVATEPAAAEPDLSAIKTAWRADYLRMRVGALEAKLIEAESAPVERAPAPVLASVPDPEPEPDPEPAVGSTEADEELARLRWRNRYLEGRLAYFEQAPEEEDEGGEPAPESAALSVVEDAAPEALETEPEAEAETTSADPEPVIEAETPDAIPETPAAETEIHPSEAMLAELEGTQPEQIDRPTDGGDDLTTITGIGPRIAEVLNGLGVWTYAQIADWLPEHETWIENHLSFKGRVSRENWVGQAKELMAPA